MVARWSRRRRGRSTGQRSAVVTVDLCGLTTRSWIAGVGWPEVSQAEGLEADSEGTRRRGGGGDEEMRFWFGQRRSHGARISAWLEVTEGRHRGRSSEASRGGDADEMQARARRVRELGALGRGGGGAGLRRKRRLGETSGEAVVSGGGLGLAGGAVGVSDEGAVSWRRRLGLLAGGRGVEGAREEAEESEEDEGFRTCRGELGEAASARGGGDGGVRVIL